MSTPTPRNPTVPIEKIFTERWSPRAFTGEKIDEATLLSFFEAARWAPSSYNSQPWRFVYAVAGTADWNTLFDLLSDSNKVWARKAGAIVLILSTPTFKAPDGSAVQIGSHAFDTGAAWVSFALQATAAGWHAHGIGGFDRESARRVLSLADDMHIQVMAVVGKIGDPATLPDPFKAREKPSNRRPLAETAFRGHLPR
jgi:nitroreductase